MKTKFYFLGLALLSVLFLASCKDDKDKDPVGKTLTNVDVSAYDKWVYLSFESGTPIVKGIDEEAPAQWDIALHRENIKTNQGSALKTAATSLNALTEVPSDEFTADVMTDSTLVVDMSQMMEGIIGYAKSELNMVLNGWVSRGDAMPPVYTVSDNIFVVKSKDGKYTKIKFTSYKNDMDKTGFATFSYEYDF
ncbi:MAG: HmuY family protein [Bacteroides sp.]|nr:HmuY family protein [Bacteroides sp.]MCM1086073.1 HmuY family protein [Bacteroides sp.]